MLCKLSRITLIAFILYAIQVHSFDDALARSDSGAHSAMELPQVPYGSYLLSCSYSSLSYSDQDFEAICGSEKTRTSMPLDELGRCYTGGFDISWNGKALVCDESHLVQSRILGNDSPPFGGYLKDCSGALYDPYEQMLYATCRNKPNDRLDQHSYRVTSLYTGSCQKGESVISAKGQLICSSSGTPKGGNNIPFGNYLTSCLGWTNTYQSGALSSYCYKRASATMRAYCKDRVTHYFLQTFSEDISHCEKSGLNICYNSHQLYCTRFLEDDFFFNLVPSPPPSGRYLQKCNHIIYDQNHDVLHANCALGDNANIYYALPDRNTWSHQCPNYLSCTICTWSPGARFYEKKLQVPSALQNVSRCVDENGLSLLDVNEEGKLYCRGPGNYELDQTCGSPTEAPTTPSAPHIATQDRGLSTDAKAIIGAAVSAVVVVTGITITGVGIVMKYLRSRGYQK